MSELLALGPLPCPKPCPIRLLAAGSCGASMEQWQQLLFLFPTSIAS